MDDPGGMGVREGVRDRDAEVRGALPAEAAPGPDEFPERGTGDELHDDPRNAAVVDDVVHGHHTRVPEPGRRPRLPLGPRDQLGPQVRCRVARHQYFLDRHFAVEAIVAGAPDPAHSAATDRLDQSVTPTHKLSGRARHTDHPRGVPWVGPGRSTGATGLG